MIEAEIEIRPRKAFREFIETAKRWCCLVVHRRGGKALDVTTPIPMADGSWKAMGDLVDGDRVLGADGKPCKIIQAHPVLHDRKCFEVEFSDGAVIVADEDHLWITQTKLDRTHRVSRYERGSGRGGKRPSGSQERRNGTVKTTRQIFDTLKYAGENNHSIPLADPAEYPEADLPIDPYIFGLWLGDGHSHTGYWTTEDKQTEIALSAYAMVNGWGFREMESQSKSCGNAKVFAITKGAAADTFNERLKALSVYRNKHVPDVYLRGSIEQRKSLLAGLMDTDGSIDKLGRKADITQKNKRIAEGVVSLLRGLGCKPSINRKIINGVDYWRVSFRPIFNPFRLRHKAIKWKQAKDEASSNNRMIVGVREVDSRPVRCITVDSSDSLYLAGDHFIPTHNTYASLQKLLLRALSHKRPGPPTRYAYIAPTQTQAKDIAWGYLKSFTWQIPGAIPNETELKITFADGMTIRLYSGENYERMRGLYFDGVVIDEPEDIDPLAWPSVIRPCLSDYQGWAIWIGTIKGKLGQWQRYLDAVRDPEWFALLLRASESGIIPQEELNDLKNSMHPDIYAQEYECDSRVSRCAFTTDSLNHQDSIAMLRRKEFGYFTDHGDGRVTWSPSQEGQAMSVRWEQPRVGFRYLVSVDSASGADQTGGEDPDSHSILVHRQGYINDHGDWVPPALVCRNIMVPGNAPGSMCCWWAEDVLEEQVYMLCTYYKAFLVPEENHDRGLIEAMKRKGISIYMRPVFNHRDNMTTRFFGWQTTTATRPRIITRLEVTMRETLAGVVGGGYEVRCPWILEQMRNFGTKPNGRMEALSGKDDDVLSLAIGNFLIEAATVYTERIVERPLPPDLQRRKDAMKSQQLGTYT